MMALQFDFSKFSTTKFETNTHTVTDAFHSIALHTDTADLTFAPAPDGQCKVTCYEPTNEKSTVTIEDGILTIRTQNTKKWYDYIGIHFITPKITVYLPQSQYQALTIRDTAAVQHRASPKPSRMLPIASRKALVLKGRTA